MDTHRETIIIIQIQWIQNKHLQNKWVHTAGPPTVRHLQRNNHNHSDMVAAKSRCLLVKGSVSMETGRQPRTIWLLGLIVGGKG